MVQICMCYVCAGWCLRVLRVEWLLRSQIFKKCFFMITILLFTTAYCFRGFDPLVWLVCK